MRLIQSLLLGTVVAFGIGGMASAADAADPAVGTWVLNLAKSKYSSPDRTPKSNAHVHAVGGRHVAYDRDRHRGRVERHAEIHLQIRR